MRDVNNGWLIRYLHANTASAFFFLVEKWEFYSDLYFYIFTSNDSVTTIYLGINISLLSKLESPTRGARSPQVFLVDPYRGQRQKTSNQLHPWFITGYADGEACFNVTIYQKASVKIGWTVQPLFIIVVHKKDLAVLELIKSTWGVGQIHKHGKNAVQFRVFSVKELAVVLEHFDKYPLKSQKLADYILFKKVVGLISTKEHLCMEGLQKILAIKASMNLGLSSALQAAFPGIIPIDRPTAIENKIPDPNWLAGFTSGEGFFGVNLIKTTHVSTGTQVQLDFRISQHIRDEKLMINLIEYLGCGKLFKYREAVEFRITKFNALVEKVIPLFAKYPIKGVKFLDYLDFVRIAELMKNKAHITKEGIDQIRKIKLGMNTNREFDLQERDIFKPKEEDSLNISYTKVNSSKVTEFEVFDDNGLLIYSFASVDECALFFGVSARTIRRRVVKNTNFAFKDQNLNIRQKI